MGDLFALLSMQQEGRISFIANVGRGRGRLFVSNLGAAQDPQILADRKISFVINASKARAYRALPGVTTLTVSIDDDPDADIAAHFARCIDFALPVLNSGHALLVHCAAGISRSVTIAAMLLIIHGMTAQSALQLLRKQRPCANPNPGFAKKLVMFERLFRQRVTQTR